MFWIPVIASGRIIAGFFILAAIASSVFLGLLVFIALTELGRRM
jgi:hypothetical protein